MNLSVATTPLTILLIAVIGIVSYLAFNNRELMGKLIYSPYRIHQTQEWYRFLSSGFIHADWMHLLFNLYVFSQFSGIIEQTFNYMFGQLLGGLALLGLFLFGVVFSHVTGYFKYKEASWYQSLGASGGVSSVLFAFIFLYPTQSLRLFFIPIDIPAFIIGAGYLWYSNYLATRGSNDNVNHEAHYYGALWGVLFVIILKPETFFSFIHQVLEWTNSFF